MKSKKKRKGGLGFVTRGINSIASTGLKAKNAIKKTAKSIGKASIFNRFDRTKRIQTFCCEKSKDEKIKEKFLGKDLPNIFGNDTGSKCETAKYGQGTQCTPLVQALGKTIGKTFSLKSDDSHPHKYRCFDAKLYVEPPIIPISLPELPKLPKEFDNSANIIFHHGDFECTFPDGTKIQESDSYEILKDITEQYCNNSIDGSNCYYKINFRNIHTSISNVIEEINGVLVKINEEKKNLIPEIHSFLIGDSETRDGKTGKQIREQQIQDLPEDSKDGFIKFLNDFKEKVDKSNQFIREKSIPLIAEQEIRSGPAPSIKIKDTIEQDGLKITYYTKETDKGTIFEMKMGDEIILQQVVQKKAKSHMAPIVTANIPLFMQMTKLLTMFQAWVDIYIKTKHNTQTTLDVQIYKDKLNEYQNSLLQITYDLKLSYNFEFNYNSYYDKYIEKFTEYINNASNNEKTLLDALYHSDYSEIYAKNHDNKHLEHLQCQHISSNTEKIIKAISATGKVAKQTVESLKYLIVSALSPLLSIIGLIFIFFIFFGHLAKPLILACLRNTLVGPFKYIYNTVKSASNGKFGTFKTGMNLLGKGFGKGYNLLKSHTLNTLGTKKCKYIEKTKGGTRRKKRRKKYKL